MPFRQSAGATLFDEILVKEGLALQGSIEGRKSIVGNEANLVSFRPVPRLSRLSADLYIPKFGINELRRASGYSIRRLLLISSRSALRLFQTYDQSLPSLLRNFLNLLHHRPRNPFHPVLWRNNQFLNNSTKRPRLRPWHC